LHQSYQKTTCSGGKRKLQGNGRTACSKFVLFTKYYYSHLFKKYEVVGYVACIDKMRSLYKAKNHFRDINVDKKIILRSGCDGMNCIHQAQVACNGEHMNTTTKPHVPWRMETLTS
jgi:hypothetical protein